MYGLRGIDQVQLRELVGRLQTYESDFADRLASRLNEVRDPTDPMSDPAYRRTFHTLARLSAQRAKVQRELSQRTVPA